MTDFEVWNLCSRKYLKISFIDLLFTLQLVAPVDIQQKGNIHIIAWIIYSGYWLFKQTNNVILCHQMHYSTLSFEHYA